jgi:NlpC/P60 family.
MRVQSRTVPVLQCVVHEGCDGLTANPSGEIHGVIISVPVSLMEKAGTYTFVLHFYDDYADSYRNHQVKAALEVNAPAEPLIFEVSTDPSGDSQEGHPGYSMGARDKMNFYVILKARLFRPGVSPPPFQTVRFLLIRDKTGERGEKTGFLVTDPKDPDGPKPHGNGYIWTYRTEHKVMNNVLYTHWVVTEKKGRWTILISPPHRSNEVKFKINKREQIVLVAESWVGATSAQLGGLCWTLASKVYGHVGFSLPASSEQYHRTIPEPTLKNGNLIFYTFTQFPNASHVAIQVDIGFVVDINCESFANKDIHPDNSIVGRHVLPRGYAASERKSPLELVILDGE